MSPSFMNSSYRDGFRKYPFAPRLVICSRSLRGIRGRNDKDKGVCALTALAHMLQHLAALLFRQIDVQNDEGGTGHVGVAVGPIEKSYCLLSVLGDMKRKREPGGLHRLLDQKHVRFIVVDNKHMKSDWRRMLCQTGRVKRKVDPRPGSDSTQIRP